MASVNTLGAPGVAIREIDLSQVAPAIQGTYCLVPGFTDQGQELEPLVINTTDDYTATYGEPTNEAERYHYYASQSVLSNGGTLIVAKLPYNNVISKNYKFVGLNVDTGTTITTAAPAYLRPLTGGTYGFTKYAAISASTATNMPTSGYDQIVAGGDFPTVASSYDFVVVDDSKSRISGPASNEGIFVAFVDPYDAMNVQRALPNPADSDVMDCIEGISYPAGIALSAFMTPLTGEYKASSLSEDVARQFPTIVYETGGDKLNPEYSQYLGVVVCRIFTDSNSQGLLNASILEAFVGSIHKGKRDTVTGQSVYLGDLINAGSKYIKFYRNETLASLLPVDSDTTVIDKASATYPLLGFTDAESAKVIQGTQVTTNLNLAFAKISNLDEMQVDVVVDAGVSTIAQFCDDAASGSLFDPVLDVDSSDVQPITSSTDIATWWGVITAMEQFCSKTRKDCMAIVDVPRHLVLQGNSKLIRKTAPNNTFGNTIAPCLRFVTGLNSSYAAMYSDWFYALDTYSGTQFWMPQTCKVGGVYCFNDAVGNIWDAPAGLNRGVVSGVVDLAFNPGQNTDDVQLYSKSINYARKYQLDGFIVEGQKTTQAKTSAFDRVNVRRLFLRLERLTRSVARYFTYEPNNLFTRRRLVDTLKPTFNAFKAAGGLYDYQIVCDERNNTAEVIDHNEMKVAVLLKPVRTAEFIEVDFVATRTDANFEEIIQQVTAV